MSFNPECTLLVPTVSSLPSDQVYKESELLRTVETGRDEEKIEALKQLILRIANGESFPKALMTVIKFCLHSENHTIKKQTLLFWETVERRGSDGKLLPEMILVCNALKLNLDHPNEYIRGNTLRLLTKLAEQDILDPLLPSIISNLAHRHSYVRKNAVMAVMAIHKNFPESIGDVQQYIDKLIEGEYSPVVKRNALVCLNETNPVAACQQVLKLLPSLQVQAQPIIIASQQIIMQSVTTMPQLKPTFLNAVYELLIHPSTSSSVLFTASNTLLMLSGAVVSVKAALNAYIQLLNKESDHNVKLVILGRIALLSKQPSILPIVQGNLLSILKALHTANTQLRSDVLSLAVAIAPPSLAIDVVNFLKKELLALSTNTETNMTSIGANVDIHSNSNQGDSEARYKGLILNALHLLVLEFPNVTSVVAPLLCTYIHITSPVLALAICHTVRSILYFHPELRAESCAQLATGVTNCSTLEVARAILWLLGEYSPIALPHDTEPQRGNSHKYAFDMLNTLDVLLLELEHAVIYNEEEDITTTTTNAMPTVTTVVTNGVYVTQTIDPIAVPTASLALMVNSKDGPTLNSIASCLTKLIQACFKLDLSDPELLERINLTHAKVLRQIVKFLQLGNSKHAVDTVYSKRSAGLEADSQERLMLCIKVLLLRDRFDVSISTEKAMDLPVRLSDKKIQAKSSVLDNLVFRHLGGEEAGAALAQDSMPFAQDQKLAVEGQRGLRVKEDAWGITKALTGLSDPVLVESRMLVSQGEVCVEYTIMNTSNKDIENVVLDLHPSPALTFNSKSALFTVPKHGQVVQLVVLTVSATDKAVILGDLVINGRSGSDKVYISLCPLQVDIVKYILPSPCVPISFRVRWAEFEWENKIPTQLEGQSLLEFVEMVQKYTNMQPIDTIDTALLGCTTDPQFLALNFHAESIFGEESLLNVSLEYTPTDKVGTIQGFCRIRAKTQGIALGLGDVLSGKIREHAFYSVAAADITIENL